MLTFKCYNNQQMDSMTTDHVLLSKTMSVKGHAMGNSMVSYTTKSVAHHSCHGCQPHNAMNMYVGDPCVSKEHITHMQNTNNV